MGNLTDIANSKVSITLKQKEGIVSSIFKDLVTMVIIGFSVYISKDSTWWTFVTGFMFIGFSIIKIGNIIDKNVTTFDDKESAIEYINNQFNK